MADKLRLTGSEIDKLIRDLGSMHDGLEARISTLNGVIDAVEGHWKGIAANAYNNLQTQVNQDVKRIKELLAFTKEAVQASKGGFDEHEVERLNDFKSVGDGSNGVLDRFQVS
ncbi:MULTISPECIES: WXG100 family type VII secretion target [Streptomyces]|uniref:WXG100 family type VII secretion target n=1 Tax=Streptomyces TaxID=1883 RepID=UPI00110FE0C7|nr:MULTISPECIES: WXG100 family type VII secretion target [unclassified Streptomyces]TMU90726.1 WXG100 family type VII secretion target [Streptomyces sp. DASNCL29]